MATISAQPARVPLGRVQGQDVFIQREWLRFLTVDLPAAIGVSGDAKSFGAKGDGVTDDSVALQAWLDAGGGFLPAGTYVVGTALTIPLGSYIIGAGPKTAILSATFNGDVLSILGDDVSVRAIGITASSARSSGSHIRIGGAYRSIVLEDLWLYNAFRAILHDGAAVITHINRCEIMAVTSSTGIGIEILGGNDTYISNTVISSSAPECVAGVRIAKSGAVWMHTVDCISTGQGLQVSPGDGEAVTWCFFTACAFDSCANEAISIAATGTGTIHGLSFDNCWGSTSDRGVYVTKPPTAQTDGLQFTSCRFLNNQKQGAYLTDATSFFFDSCTVAGNSIASVGTYAGIEINGVSMSNFGVRNCHIGQALGFSNLQGYGIKIGTGCDGYTITGNHVLNNTVAGLLDASIGSSNYRTIAHNVGFVSEAQGAGPVAAAASTVLVSHGLGFTPADGDIVISPTSNYGASGVTYAWVSAYTSTTFTVTLNTAAVAVPVTFAWNARLK